MASYTGMSNLQNHPHRSGFDIGRKNAFTAKVGELLPVYWDISMPGDKYKFNVEYFTRTQPVETSAYTRLREYFDFYAVPLRLLWKSAPSVLTQMQDINQIQALSFTQNLSLGTYLPSITLDQLSSCMPAEARDCDISCHSPTLRQIREPRTGRNDILTNGIHPLSGCTR